MATKYILAGLSVVFFVLAAVRMASGRDEARIQARTWLLVGAIFAGVSAWLFLNG
jgi:NO-binding membrane sensor protein with MHYT domain